MSVVFEQPKALSIFRQNMDEIIGAWSELERRVSGLSGRTCIMSVFFCARALKALQIPVNSMVGYMVQERGSAHECYEHCWLQQGERIIELSSGIGTARTYHTERPAGLSTFPFIGTTFARVQGLLDGSDVDFVEEYGKNCVSFFESRPDVWPHYQRFVRAYNHCVSCKKADVTLRRCLGCEAVRYCSKQCQKADWKGHRQHCKN